MKVERVTYPAMTPSAARGILEAIFWKPEFDWRIREIRLLKPVVYYALTRNEIEDRQSPSSDAATGGNYFVEEHRAQRHTIALRDVAYIIVADQELRPHARDDVAKYRDQFRRRVQDGKFFHQPCLGCREFPAFFEASNGETPIPDSFEIGPMLFDLAYAPDKSGRGRPVFFDANVEKGVLRVPADLYDRGGEHAP
jgi:CRISPR-associated protein Cas5d